MSIGSHACVAASGPSWAIACVDEYGSAVGQNDQSREPLGDVIEMDRHRSPIAARMALQSRVLSGRSGRTCLGSDGRIGRFAFRTRADSAHPVLGYGDPDSEDDGHQCRDQPS
jgi:hypothetical protein